MPRPPFDIGGDIGKVVDWLIKTLGGRLDVLEDLLGGLKIKVGKSTLVFTASSTSAQVTVTHGLGKAPLAVFATCATPVGGRFTIQESAAASNTQAFFTGFQTQGTNVSASQDFYWLAVG